MKINEMNDEEIHRLCNLFYKLIFQQIFFKLQ